MIKTSMYIQRNKPDLEVLVDELLRIFPFFSVGDERDIERDRDLKEEILLESLIRKKKEFMYNSLMVGNEEIKVKCVK